MSENNMEQFVVLERIIVNGESKEPGSCIALPAGTTWPGKIKRAEAVHAASAAAKPAETALLKDLMEAQKQAQAATAYAEGLQKELAAATTRAEEHKKTADEQAAAAEAAKAELAKVNKELADLKKKQK